MDFPSTWILPALAAADKRPRTALGLVRREGRAKNHRPGSVAADRNGEGNGWFSASRIPTSHTPSQPTPKADTKNPWRRVFRGWLSHPGEEQIQGKAPDFEAPTRGVHAPNYRWGGKLVASVWPHRYSGQKEQRPWGCWAGQGQPWRNTTAGWSRVPAAPFTSLRNIRCEAIALPEIGEQTGQASIPIRPRHQTISCRPCPRARSPGTPTSKQTRGGLAAVTPSPEAGPPQSTLERESLALGGGQERPPRCIRPPPKRRPAPRAAQGRGERPRFLCFRVWAKGWNGGPREGGGATARPWHNSARATHVRRWLAARTFPHP